MMQRLAAYLDEASEDPLGACEVLKQHSFSNVALRHAWSENVCGLQDHACNRLRTALTDAELQVVLVASTLGQVPATDLGTISDEQIRRVFDVTKYFGAKFIRIAAGHTATGAEKQVSDWMARIEDFAIADVVVPVLELTEDAYLYQPATLAMAMGAHRRWRLLYDPAQLIIRRHLDPFVKYWTLLKRSVALIDLHDYKIGHGFKPPGFGDAKLDLTLRDAITSGYSGWYILEPSLGRRYGDATSKSATFSLAVEGLRHLLESTGLSET